MAYSGRAIEEKIIVVRHQAFRYVPVYNSYVCGHDIGRVLSVRAKCLCIVLLNAFHYQFEIPKPQLASI